MTTPIITDDGQGNLSMTCSHSGKPYCRSNEYGMFCADVPCFCEDESKRVMPDGVDAFIKQLFDRMPPI